MTALLALATKSGWHKAVNGLNDVKKISTQVIYDVIRKPGNPTSPLVSWGDLNSV